MIHYYESRIEVKGSEWVIMVTAIPVRQKSPGHQGDVTILESFDNGHTTGPAGIL